MSASPTMTPERWRLVQDLLQQVLDRDPSERTAWLTGQCADDPPLRQLVGELVTHAEGDASAFLDRPVLRLDVEAPPATDLSGQSLGPWVLDAPLGHGGMGEVYRAHRHDSYQQEVAVKLLRPGLTDADLRLRFRSERQILAHLEHPGIARLLDGGTAPDGRPYLVLELVEGLPIDRHCRDRRLPLEQRLALFRRVCDAVHFAHQRLVVHRDLKPGNILVTDAGKPKLLDFGIAKLLHPEGFDHTIVPTAPGQQAMTLDYASPEQVRGQGITTASDVYSLGVLLYELLTGERPYRVQGGDPQEVLDKICHTWPERPSSRLATVAPAQRPPGELSRLRRRLRGDLDKIVLKAIHKDPRQRYGSAERLAEDLDRFLHGLPVEARPATLGYRAAKFCQRHRFGVALATLAAVALLTLVSGLVLQRGQFLHQRDLSENVSFFLVDLFRSQDPDLTRGSPPSAAAVLARGVDRIDEGLRDQPELQAELRLTLGRSYLNLGQIDEAEPLLLHSLDALRRSPQARATGVAEALGALSQVATLRADYGTAETYASEALELYRRNARRWATPRGAPQRPVEGLVQGLVDRGHVRQLAGRWDEAQADFLEALATARPLDNPRPRAAVLEKLAQLLEQQGRLEDAEARYREALGVYRAELGEQPHRRVAYLLNNLGSLLQTRGDIDTALQHFRRAEAMQRQLFAGDHPDLATTLYNLGVARLRQDRRDLAEPALEAALAMYLETVGEAHPKTAYALTQLARLDQDQGNLDRAEHRLTRALAIRRQALGEHHPQTALSLRQLAQLAVDRGSLESAEALYLEALEIQQEALGNEHHEVAVTLNNLADLAQLRGEVDTAIPRFERALTILRRTLGTTHSDVAMLHYNLATARHRQGTLDLAAEHYDEALRIARQALGDSHRKVGLILLGTSSIRYQQGAADAAAEAAVEALEIFDRSLALDHPWRLATLDQGAHALVAAQRFAEAHRLLEDLLDQHHALHGPDHEISRRTQGRLDALDTAR